MYENFKVENSIVHTTMFGSVLPAAIKLLPRYRPSKFGRRAFSVAGPMVWNSLPDHLQDPTLSSDCFKSRLKTHYLFSLY